jgi:hypothetical protein
MTDKKKLTTNAGAADAERDIRGLATKCYTEEGTRPASWVTRPWRSRSATSATA